MFVQRRECALNATTGASCTAANSISTRLRADQQRQLHIDAKRTKTPGYWPGALNFFAKVIDQTGRLPPTRTDSSHQQGQ